MFSECGNWIKPKNKNEFVKRWRAAKMPRLYWRSAHPKWRWDRNEMARMDGMRFYGPDGLFEMLEHGERLERMK